jgi:hypothetical protein
MYVSPVLAEKVRDEFFAFVEGFDESNEAASYELLQDYICTWIVTGTGVEVTGGDYATYLLAVLIIIHEYTKNPTRLNYLPLGEADATTSPPARERRVRGLIDLDGSGGGIFDPHFYREQVFIRQMATQDPE